MSLDSLLRATGKNLFDINTTPTFTRTGATYTVSGATITFKSNNTTNNSFYYSIPVEIGKTYTVSVSSINWDSTSLGIFLSSTTAPDRNNYGIINKTTLSKTFTATANTLWIHGYLSYSAGDFTFSFDKLQLELGSTATTYEPYEYLGPKTIIIPSNSKNLIKYPYTETTKTQKGITFTDNGDGTITVNGTSTGLATFTLGSVSLDNTKSYFLYGKNTSSNLPLRIQIGQAWRVEEGNGLAISQVSGNACTITLGALKGFTFNNVIIYPQLEEGLVATDYKVNTGDKEVLKVSYGSRNLWQNTNTTFPAALSYDSNTQTYTMNTGTAGYNFVAHTLTNPIPAGTTGTISIMFQSGKGRSVTIGGYHRTGGRSWQGYINVPSNVDMTGQTLTSTFTTTETVEEFMVFHNTGDNIEEPFIFKVQYEMGNKATEYVPYFNTTVWTKKA